MNMVAHFVIKVFSLRVDSVPGTALIYDELDRPDPILSGLKSNGRDIHYAVKPTNK